MTPGDVMDEIMASDGRLKYADEQAAIHTWGALSSELKPELAHMPMSPAELESAELVLDRLRLALSRAKTRNRAHVRLIAKGASR